MRYSERTVPGQEWTFRISNMFLRGSYSNRECGKTGHSINSNCTADAVTGGLVLVSGLETGSGPMKCISSSVLRVAHL